MLLRRMGHHHALASHIELCYSIQLKYAEAEDCAVGFKGNKKNGFEVIYTKINLKTKP